MVQTMEAIQGGRRSIRVGTTGTISALMSRELESSESATTRNTSPTVSVLVPSGANIPKPLKPITSADDASSSGSGNSIDHKSPENVRRTKHYNRKTHHIPMLGSDNISLDGTPIRRKPDKNGSNIVEIVDIKCGNRDRTWTTPITNRLKKLSFSKLSESVV
ncbi:unnamed protein product [Ilex paraguariensis]|uniref:Uncharacterized protein n=1 Tax=Ilex paraguariensis TaxID=185542 RepID=A0ABC8S025_9AQUA